MANDTMTASPAVGPLMPRADPLNGATIIPLIMPAINPENKGAPDASAIPKDNGIATRKTAMPAGKSYFRLANGSS